MSQPNQSPWYVDFFGQDYLRLYRPFLPPERTLQETDGIVALLNLPPGSAILDLCCGHGRHCIELARRGYRVTGYDLSALFLEEARRDAVAAGVDARWRQGDMRDLPYIGEFDAVINIFNAFGYLDDETDDARVLTGVRRALRPGGLFLQEIANRESVVRHYQDNSVTRYDDGLILVEEQHFNLLTSRNDVTYTLLHPDGQRSTQFHSLRTYTLTELASMYAAAGLALDAYHGGLDGSALGFDSTFLVTLCHA